MFQVRLLLCLIILVSAQAGTNFIRGEIVNPASRIVNNGKTTAERTATPPSFSSGPAGMKQNRLQSILQFQAVKKYSASQPTRKAR